MKIIKRIDKTKTYTAKDGKTYPSINYYVVLPNNKWIAIRPSFYKDTYTLDAVAEVIVNE